MIAPMKRVYLALHEKDKLQVLNALGKLGLVHLEPVQGVGEEYERLVAEQKSMMSAISSVERYVDKKSKREKHENPQACAESINALVENRKLREEAISALTKGIEYAREWGNFDPDLIRQLGDGGLAITLMTMPKKKLSELDSGIQYILVKENKGRAYLACINLRDSETPVHPEAIIFDVPAKSMLSLIEERTMLEKQVDEDNGALKELSVYYYSLVDALRLLEKQIKFKAVFSGMEQQESIAWLAGWLPEKELPAFTAFASEMKIAYVLDDPLDEELPPTKVENNAVVSIIKPVFDFIGSVPNYREYDISGLFLAFFTIFFAMIFGDGGYGSIIFLFTLFSILSSVIRKKPVSQLLKLVLLLSGATVVWGIISGSWFGINYENLPSTLQNSVLPWISPKNPNAEENIKVLCFIIGLVQLNIAHLKNIVRDFPSPKFIGQAGQLSMVNGMFYVVLNLIVNPQRYVIPGWAMVLIGAGFAVSFLFSSYDDSKHNFVKGLVSGLLSQLQNIVSVLLGVVNVFGDIVSYIRLWAVGLAGLAMSQTVNNLAGPVFGSFIKFLIAVAILFMGHGINVVLSILSVLVHGIRLNMLEFSSHLGMEWSGYGYTPFSESISERDSQE